jgi:hypothetical protein
MAPKRGHYAVIWRRVAAGGEIKTAEEWEAATAPFREAVPSGYGAYLVDELRKSVGLAIDRHKAVEVEAAEDWRQEMALMLGGSDSERQAKAKEALRAITHKRAYAKAIRSLRPTARNQGGRPPKPVRATVIKAMRRYMRHKPPNGTTLKAYITCQFGEIHPSTYKRWRREAEKS